jgi:hypothetical protein
MATASARHRNAGSTPTDDLADLTPRVVAATAVGTGVVDERPDLDGMAVPQSLTMKPSRCAATEGHADRGQRGAQLDIFGIQHPYLAIGGRTGTRAPAAGTAGRSCPRPGRVSQRRAVL